MTDAPAVTEILARAWIDCDPNREGSSADKPLDFGTMVGEPRWRWFIPRAEALVAYLAERGLCIAPAAAKAKSFSDGSFIIYRKLPRGFSKTVGGYGIPRFRHRDRESAEREAARLLTVYPESTFIVFQEVATVKLRPASADRSGEADETSTKIEVSAEGESAVPAKQGDAHV